MSLPYAILGSFPTEPQDYQRSVTRAPGTSFRDPETPRYNVDDALEALFVSRELGAAKSAAQKPLKGQLDTLTYFAIGFQVFKYTHGSYKPPTLAYLLVQLLLYTRQFTTTRPGSGRQIFAEYLNPQERHFQAAGISFDRQQIIDFIFLRMRNVILWEVHCVCRVPYAPCCALFPAVGYCRPPPFVGEELSQKVMASSPWWLQLWQLGLFGLLAIYLGTLILQLVLYQSIFIHSTISPKGIRLNEQECYILRASGSGQSLEAQRSSGEVPDILHAELFLEMDPVTAFET